MARRWGAVLRTPLGASAATLLVAVLVLAVVAPLLWTDQANAVDTGQIMQGGSAEHWAGTDSLGRDIFFRVLVATRLTVQLALMATVLGVTVGLLLGTAQLMLGQWLGRVITAVVNIAVAFPGLLLALFFAVIFGVGTVGAVLAIGLAIAPAFARLTQTLIAGVAGLDYVAAARIAGVGRFRVLFRHVLPNVAEPLVVSATVGAGNTLLAFAGLSFVGLGVQAPDYDWGRLLGEGLGGLYVHPEAALAPGIAVVLAGLAFNLFGEAIAKGVGHATPRPRLRRRRPVAPAPDDSAMLVVDDLSVGFPGTTPVRGVSFTMQRGDAVGLVGESGSGKSLTALAVARLVEEPGEVTAARLSFQGADLRVGDHRRLLGTSFAMVFQDPMTSFNPTMRVGRQLAEVAVRHQGLSRRAALARAVDRLGAVRLSDPERRARQFPHEFSGGMRQRAMIGMGLMGTPALIVADEPTTALDVTVQRQVLDLLASIRAADGVGLLLISHDLTVVERVCDRVLVMYAGRIVEDLPATALRSGAMHPYTRALLAAVPDMTTDRSLPLTVIPGRPADPADLPPGCAFAPRCPLATDRCRETDPALTTTDDGRRVACWHAEIPAEVGKR
ncbi:dipeptide/oligopeptide/nickel ABC transporter permease/ATP-binding protein [Actinophytocola oryzae]|uniref:Oligopeptide/dipeptide ABC transporter ATP-binding protein n=1 Tax=Actinophytocola oryzae TaxID=502181 RepID=A0A4R7W400_9PSEU|nr:dipeptide/oligopeptide/nickel ABC transporter permease/ATP-binding protein [Actinophytocola oryzae]TDV57420.1 oligopeptide/dipeptide ABC transporter ATP-binding protein [Actinophytocola oryzae]